MENVVPRLITGDARSAGLQTAGRKTRQRVAPASPQAPRTSRLFSEKVVALAEDSGRLARVGACGPGLVFDRTTGCHEVLRAALTGSASTSSARSSSARSARSAGLQTGIAAAGRETHALWCSSTPPRSFSPGRGANSLPPPRVQAVGSGDGPGPRRPPGVLGGVAGQHERCEHPGAGGAAARRLRDAPGVRGGGRGDDQPPGASEAGGETSRPAAEVKDTPRNSSGQGCPGGLPQIQPGRPPPAPPSAQALAAARPGREPTCSTSGAEIRRDLVRTNTELDPGCRAALHVVDGRKHPPEPTQTAQERQERRSSDRHRRPPHQAANPPTPPPHPTSRHPRLRKRRTRGTPNSTEMRCHGLSAQTVNHRYQRVPKSNCQR